MVHAYKSHNNAVSSCLSKYVLGNARLKEDRAIMSGKHARRIICGVERPHLIHARSGRYGPPLLHKGGMNANMPITVAERTGRPRFPRPVIILVVEDEALVSMNVCEFLVEQEFTVFAAQDAGEALGLLEQLDGKVDLMFTDVNMPGELNGFDLVRQVSIRWPAMRIVITSGGCDPGDLPADLRRYGPMLMKPYSLGALDVQMVNAIFPPSEPMTLLAT